MMYYRSCLFCFYDKGQRITGVVKYKAQQLST